MLELLISHPELRQAAAEAAQQRVRERYLWNDVAAQIERAYRELISRPGNRPAFHGRDSGSQDRRRPAA
jgi:hypothetical protein